MPLDRRAFLIAAPAAGPALAATGAGASAQPLQAAGVDATELGVTPDAPRDQTDALQAAIDQAATRRVPLILPPGILLTRTLTLRPGSRVLGVGPATRMASAGDGPIFEAKVGADLYLGSMTLDGGRDEVVAAGGAAALVDLALCERAVLEGLEVTGGRGNGIALERSSGSIRGCRVSGAREAAIFAIDSEGLEIVHNTVEDCADNGILVWRSAPGDDGTIVAGNRIRRIGAASGGSGEYGNGVNVFRAGGVIVEANRIEDCAYSAVRSNSGSDCQIIGNACRGLGEVALYAEFAFEGAVISGNLVDDAATGVAITNFDQGGRLAVCSSNIVRNLHTRDHEDARGDGIAVEADTLVTGNLVENAPVAGISLGWGRYMRDVSATSNIVRQCGVGIAVSVSDGAGTALISGNLISNSRRSAIQAFDWDEAIGGDLLDASAAGYSHLTIAGNARG